MQERFDKSDVRGGRVLGWCRLGSCADARVDLAEITEFIPPAMLVTVQHILSGLDGKFVKSLAQKELELVNLVIGMRNSNLILDLSCDQYPDTRWTPELQEKVLTHKVRSRSVNMKAERAKQLQQRQGWCNKLNNLLQSLFPTEVVQDATANA